MSSYSNPTLATSFEDVLLLIPSDNTDLDVAPVGLRIANISSDWATVAFIPVGSTAARQIMVPPNSLVSEPLRIRRLLQTGTTPELVISGYFHV